VATTKITDSDQVADYKDVFGLLNTQVYLPLGVTAGNFNLELGYSINMPVTKDVNITYPIMSYYNVSLSFLLPIMK
jgi:hypothetical protein